MAILPYPSPLRYPGGKNKIVGYVKALFEQNGLLDGDFAEPYAGGASVGLSLLSYDNTPEIQQLYWQHEGITYDLAYSARQARQGQEALFFSAGLRRPQGSSSAKTAAAGTSRLQTNFL